MGLVSAIDASERCLVFAISRVDVAALIACARSIARIDPNERSAGGLQFVGEHGFELEPTLLEDRAVEAGFGFDVFSRLAVLGSLAFDDRRQFLAEISRFLQRAFIANFFAHIDAFVANEYGWTRDNSEHLGF